MSRWSCHSPADWQSLNQLLLGGAVAMETRTLLTLALAVLATGYQQFAQECRIYQLRGGTPQYESPLISIQNHLTVSFYMEEVGEIPKNIHIILKDETRNGTKKNTIHINPDGVLFLSRAKLNNLTFSSSCYSQSWISLAVMLQDNNIIIYDINNRMNYISARTMLGSNATAKITTNQESLLITTNCPAGCLMHDHNSPLIGYQMDLRNSVNIYLSHEEGAVSASITLGFTDYLGKSHKVMHDITNLKSSLWHKLVIAHDGEEHVIVLANGKEISKVKISEHNSTFTVLNSTSILWSLHCHPDHATGLKGWGFPVPANTTEEEEEEEEGGAGAAEVVAWVLAGMALFLVMIMALFICTKMSPKSETVDYGASVGVVTSYGRAMSYRKETREAEEDTEPDSPTFLAPVIQHKVPEEEDEDQSNTKML